MKFSIMSTLSNVPIIPNYTGMTNSIGRRIFEHNSGKNTDCYTFIRRPVVLVWFESFSDPTQAIMIEKQIKDWSRRKKKLL